MQGGGGCSVWLEAPGCELFLLVHFGAVFWGMVGMVERGR